MNDIRVRTGLVPNKLSIEVQIPGYSTYESIDITPTQAHRLLDLLTIKLRRAKTAEEVAYPNVRGNVDEMVACLIHLATGGHDLSKQNRALRVVTRVSAGRIR